MLFVSGILLILALYVPMSMLQDSKAPPPFTGGHVKGSSQCPTFAPPHAPVGRYDCMFRRPGTSKELQTVCWLVCPPGMTARPSTTVGALYRCHNGKWKAVKDPVQHCAALTPVPLVEQQMASPEMLNSLLHKYLNHSYGYLSMAYFFDRADVQLPGFHKYFLGMWKKSTSMAGDIMSYINRRGGWIDLNDLPRPALTEKMHLGLADGNVGLAAMTTALDMERESQSQVLKMIERIEKKKLDDPHLMHVLEDQHLAYKVTVIKELVNYITQLTSFKAEGEDYQLGEYQLDISLQ